MHRYFGIDDCLAVLDPHGEFESSYFLHICRRFTCGFYNGAVLSVGDEYNHQQAANFFNAITGSVGHDCRHS